MPCPDLSSVGDSWGALARKAQVAERLLGERHLHAGLVIPMFTDVFAEQQPRHVYLLSATEQTAKYLAALSLQSVSEPFDDADRIIDRTLSAVERAHSLTHVRGIIARGYVPAGLARDWDFPMQHDKLHEGDGCLWLSGAHVDNYCAVLYACAICYDLCATESQRTRIRDLVSALLDTLLANDLVVVDVDEILVEECNLGPDKFGPDRRVVALQALQLFLIGHRLTEREQYLATYRELITTFGYADKGSAADLDGWGPRDDLRAFEAYYHLIQYEDDPDLVALYRCRLGEIWKCIRGDERGYLAVIYAVLSGNAALGREIAGILARMDIVKEFPHGGAPDGSGPFADQPVPVEQRPPVLFESAYSPRRTWYAKTYLAPVDFLITYWMARHHGIIS